MKPPKAQVAKSNAPTMAEPSRRARQAMQPRIARIAPGQRRSPSAEAGGWGRLDSYRYQDIGAILRPSFAACNPTGALPA